LGVLALLLVISRLVCAGASFLNRVPEVVNYICSVDGIIDSAFNRETPPNNSQQI
jgi:hypothetical protein